MRKWRLTALGTLIALIEVGKFFFIHQLHVNLSFYQSHTEVCVDELLIPAFLAVWIQRGSHQQLLKRLLPSWSFFILFPLFIRLLCHYSLSPMTAFAAPLLLLSTIYHPHMFVGRFLESKPLKWIGRLSYSLYLWQQLFICHRFVGYEPLGILERRPVNFALILACATASFTSSNYPPCA